MRWLVTGGAGFIGSAFVRALRPGERGSAVLVLDALTYAGNLANLHAVSGRPGFEFELADVRDEEVVSDAFERFRPDCVVHFAAESHVDRSILSPGETVSTNVQGTSVLLEAARRRPPERFVQVSTDEVYGSVEEPRLADESFPLRPSSPYAASKAAADHLALSYWRTFGLPVTVTRCSNNYGPRQFPEKLVPLMIANALEGLPLPLYGDGCQMRDWIHVDDHCRALLAAVERGRPGEVYNIGGGCRLPNLGLVRRILRLTNRPETLLEFVPDRPAHDRRYALCSEKLETHTGWQPQVRLDDGLQRTIDWYLRHPEWVDRVRSGEYRDYYERNYGWRSRVAAQSECR